jgi:hypothetical protein
MDTLEAVRAVLDHANMLDIRDLKTELKQLHYQRSILDEKILAAESKLDSLITKAIGENNARGKQTAHDVVLQVASTRRHKSASA